MDPNLLGARIRTARGLRRKTLDEVAEQIGVNKSTVQRYENGLIRTPKIPVLKALSEALEVQYAWLVGEHAQMEPEGTELDSAAVLRLLERRPELRALMKAAQGISAAQIRAISDFLTAMKT